MKKRLFSLMVVLAALSVVLVVLVALRDGDSRPINRLNEAEATVEWADSVRENDGIRWAKEPTWVAGRDLPWLYGTWQSGDYPLDAPFWDASFCWLELWEDRCSLICETPYTGFFGLPGSHWSAGFSEDSASFQFSFDESRRFEYDRESELMFLVRDDGSKLSLKRTRTENLAH